jgi:hypothetical protein
MPFTDNRARLTPGLLKIFRKWFFAWRRKSA